MSSVPPSDPVVTSGRPSTVRKDATERRVHYVDVAGHEVHQITDWDDADWAYSLNLLNDPEPVAPGYGLFPPAGTRSV
jgi:hypothetical protein